MELAFKTVGTADLDLRPWDDIGCGKLTPAEEALTREHLPAFDPATARANPGHGWLAELFRTRPGCVASANPGARMGALGARASWGPGNGAGTRVPIRIGDEELGTLVLEREEPLAPGEVRAATVREWGADVQWIDASSARALEFACRRLRQRRRTRPGLQPASAGSTRRGRLPVVDARGGTRRDGR